MEDKNLKLGINPFENDSNWNVYSHFYVEYLTNLNKSIGISSYKCGRRFFNSDSSINMETNYLGIIGTSIIFNLNSYYLTIVMHRLLILSKDITHYTIYNVFVNERVTYCIVLCLFRIPNVLAVNRTRIKCI